MATNKTRIQKLIEAIKDKRWHNANVLTSRILEGKVMVRLDAERRVMFKEGFVKECPMDGDGGSPMSDNPGLKKEDDEKFGQEGEPDKDALKEGLGCKCDCKQCDRGDHCGGPECTQGLEEGYYRVTYMDGKKERTLKFEGSPSQARAKVQQEVGSGREIVDVETIGKTEYDAMQES